MGAFTTGFDQGSQAGATDLAHQRMVADEQRRTNLGLLTNAWNQSTDPTQRDSIKSQIDSLYPTPEHGPAMLADLFHLHHKELNQRQQTTAAQTATPPTTDPISGLPLTPAPASPAETSGPQVPSQPADQPAPSATANVRQVAAAPTAADAWKQITAIPSPTETAINTSQRTAKNQQDLEKLRADSAEKVATIRTQGNAAMQKLDAAAQSLGADSFATATPEQKIEAMKTLHAANVTQTWKAITDGNDIYAVDAHDPNKRQLLGHKADLTQHLEYKSGQNADGSTYLIPVVTWTRKGSTQPLLQTQGEPPSGDAGEAAPISSNTPSAPGTKPANTGARAPGTKPAGAPSKVSATTVPGSGIPKGAIPTGSKGSPLLKSDTAQYTKVAEDANGAAEALTSAKAAASNPSPTSDQELIYSWVRSNVQGAGRMTQAEFSQAAHTGSLPQKAANWYSLVSTGKMTPVIRNMMLADIERGARTKQQTAAGLRTQVQQDMSPTSSKTPAGPGSNGDDDLVKRLNEALGGK